MQTVGAFDAKTHLSDLSKKVSHGESFVITKRGRPIATLAPILTIDRPGPRDIIMEFRKKHAKGLKKVSLQEIIQWKESGRR